MRCPICGIKLKRATYDKECWHCINCMWTREVKMRIRPAVLLGEIILGTICALAMYLNYKEVAVAAVVGICALLPKLVDSEEKTDVN